MLSCTNLVLDLYHGLITNSCVQKKVWVAEVGDKAENAGLAGMITM